MSVSPAKCAGPLSMRHQGGASPEQLQQIQQRRRSAGEIERTVPAATRRGCDRRWPRALETDDRDGDIRIRRRVSNFAETREVFDRPAAQRQDAGIRIEEHESLSRRHRRPAPRPCDGRRRRLPRTVAVRPRRRPIRSFSSGSLPAPRRRSRASAPGRSRHVLMRRVEQRMRQKAAAIQPFVRMCGEAAADPGPARGT